MPEFSIEAYGLGKRYQLGTDLGGGLPYSASRGVTPDAFWALHDVSFKVAPGEAIGILGQNGAGKSTLLKVLSRVVRPSSGRATIRGRLGCLLEVGTGFHPDLSGRDNIYLSGAILGMPYREVERKFEGIVDFSGIGEFIDVPVKRYSSGMYVKLAFAVASFLEPDILIVDEVLAVGDAAFQRKSLGSLNRSSQTLGKSVLFVSHNLEAVRAFCTRVLVLSKGELVFDGRTSEGVEQYLRSLPTSPTTQDISSTEYARIGALWGPEGLQGNSWLAETGRPLTLTFEYEVIAAIPSLSLRLAIKSASDEEAIAKIDEVISIYPLPAGSRGRVSIGLDNIPLKPGEFVVLPSLMTADFKRRLSRHYDLQDAPYLKVESASKDRYARIGLVELPFKFTSELKGVRSRGGKSTM